MSASVTGLAANTTYHFRISATNLGGTSKGSDEAFKTAPQGTCEEAHERDITADEKCWHYFVGGKSNAARELASGEHMPVVSWGTLTLTNETTGDAVTCHNVVGGWVENPGTGADGPPGVGETQAFDPYECESSACYPGMEGSGPDTYISVSMENDATVLPNTVGPQSAENGDAADLGWRSHLTPPSGGGKFARSETEGVKVDVVCHVNTGFNGNGRPEYVGRNTEETSSGSDRPECSPYHGTPASPPYVEFNAGSGTLTDAGGEHVKTTGDLETLGYGGQETINCLLG